MSHIYEGSPDTRQSAKRISTTLFRKRYQPLDDAGIKLHDEIKDTADDLAHLIASIALRTEHSPARPVGLGADEEMLASLTHNKTANIVLALRHLEDAVYRAVKALTT